MGGQGSGGRNRKPKAIKVLEGDRAKIGREKLAAIREPVASGTPQRPDYFSRDQNRLWDAVLASAPPQLLTAADTAMIEMFVVAWDTLRQANRQIASTSLLIRSERGAIKNPLFAIRRMATADLNAAGQVLGMSPWARCRLIAPETPTDDPMELLLAWGDDPNEEWSSGPKTRQ